MHSPVSLCSPVSPAVLQGACVSHPQQNALQHHLWRLLAAGAIQFQHPQQQPSPQQPDLLPDYEREGSPEEPSGFDPDTERAQSDSPAPRMNSLFNSAEQHQGLRSATLSAPPAASAPAVAQISPAPQAVPTSLAALLSAANNTVSPGGSASSTGVSLAPAPAPNSAPPMAAHAVPAQLPPSLLAITPDPAGAFNAREKNRQAQRRFRERQRGLIQELKDRVSELEANLSEAQRSFALAQEEKNELMARLRDPTFLANHLAALTGAAEVPMTEQTDLQQQQVQMQQAQTFQQLQPAPQQMGASLEMYGSNLLQLDGASSGHYPTSTPAGDCTPARGEYNPAQMDQTTEQQQQQQQQQLLLLQETGLPVLQLPVLPRQQYYQPHSYDEHGQQPQPQQQHQVESYASQHHQEHQQQCGMTAQAQSVFECVHVPALAGMPHCLIQQQPTLQPMQL